MSDSAWRAMIAAGLDVEAQAINEQMFSNWLGNNIQQIQAALDIGSLRDAKTHIDICRQALKICGKHSQIIEVFHQTILLLDTQVNLIISLQTRSVQQPILNSMVKSHLQIEAQKQIRRRNYASVSELVMELPVQDEYALIERPTDYE